MTSFTRPTNAPALQIERPALKVYGVSGEHIVYEGDQESVAKYVKNLPSANGYTVQNGPHRVAAETWLHVYENSQQRALGLTGKRPGKVEEPISGKGDARYNPACPYCVKGTKHLHNAEWSQMMLRRQGIGRA